MLTVPSYQHTERAWIHFSRVIYNKVDAEKYSNWGLQWKWTILETKSEYSSFLQGSYFQLKYLMETW